MDRHTVKILDLVTEVFDALVSVFFILAVIGFTLLKVVAFFKRNIDPIKRLLDKGNLLGDNKRRKDRPGLSRSPHFVGLYGCVHSCLSALRFAFSSFRLRFRAISFTFQGVSATALARSSMFGVFC